MRIMDSREARQGFGVVQGWMSVPLELVLG
jgi:hypothetical protein